MKDLLKACLRPCITTQGRAVTLVVLLAITASNVLAQEEDPGASKHANLDRYKGEIAADVDNLRRFLEERALLQVAVGVENSFKPVAQASLSEADRPARISPNDYDEVADLMHSRQALSLVLDGYTTGQITALRSQGIDIFDVTLKPAFNHSAVEKAMFSELVIVGKVEEIIETLEPEDGYRSSVKISVQQVLSGETLNNVVTLRQASGKSSDGRNVHISVDIHKEYIGQEFVFYLSNTRYRFFTSYPHRYMDPGSIGPPPQEALQQYYVNRYSPEALTPSLGREILSEIERVGSIIEASKTAHE